MATHAVDRPLHVVGVDGSEESKAALRWAQRIAPGLGAGIEATIAWDYPIRAYGWAPDMNAVKPDDDAARVIDDTIDAAHGNDGPPPGLEITIRRGDARDVLLEASRQALMLIVGTHGHGRLSRALHESVSSACTEHAHCPVLVVHGDDLQRGAP